MSLPHHLHEADFLGHFCHVFRRCSHVPQSSPTKFKHRIALISGYYLRKFQPKRSTRDRDRSRGISLTKHIFWPFLHVFAQTSHITWCNPTKFTHNIALISNYYLLKFQPKRSAGGWDTGRGVRVVKNTFQANSGQYHNWYKTCFYHPHAAAPISGPCELFWLKF